MNKEVIIAITIGIILGLSGAVYSSTMSARLARREGKATAQVTVPAKPRVIEQLSFNSLPANNKILTKPTLYIAGKANNEAMLIIGNVLGINNISVKEGKFSHDLSLKPGLNDIIIGEQTANNEQLKLIKIFYLVKQKRQAIAQSDEDKEATGEAQALKKKLEETVFQLRENAQKALYGIVVSINENEVVLDVSGKKIKVKLEPEVTQFFDVNDDELDELTIDDIEKNDAITVFISKIADEERSYVVYREPSETMIAGKISNLDSDNYIVSVVNFDKATVEVGIEASTTQSVYDKKSGTIERYGFSKLNIGDFIYAIIANTGKDTHSAVEYLAVPALNKEE